MYLYASSYLFWNVSFSNMINRMNLCIFLPWISSWWCGLWLTTMVTVTATWCQLLSIGSKYAHIEYVMVSAYRIDRMRLFVWYTCIDVICISSVLPRDVIDGSLFKISRYSLEHNTSLHSHSCNMSYINNNILYELF